MDQANLESQQVPAKFLRESCLIPTLPRGNAYEGAKKSITSPITSAIFAAESRSQCAREGADITW